MSTLTKRQAQILSAITSFTRSQGYLPSYRELMPLLGITSTATLHKHIQNLIALGHLKKLDRGSRSVKTTKKTSVANANEIAIIGSVAKGKKIDLFKEADFFEIPPSLASITKTLYGFVLGDDSFSSMHMLKGDLIVVEAKQEPHSGEMILAYSKSSGAQVGRYHVSFTERTLEVDGKALDFEENELRIQGVIAALFRKYSTGA